MQRLKSDQIGLDRWDAAAPVRAPRRRRRALRRPSGRSLGLGLVGLAAFVWLAGASPANADRAFRNGWNCVVASLQLSNATRQLKAFYYAEARLPQDVSSFLAQALGKPRGSTECLDPWGRPYRLEKTLEGFTLRSAGVDRKYWTGDDLTASATLQKER